MPGFDGTGPLGQGPMTGRGRGFCVLKSSKENPGQVEGLAGLQGRPISRKVNNFRMPYPGRANPYFYWGLGRGIGRFGYWW
ncbi:MAG: DUF5320 domain-containing protein [Sedimentisphaerales bacterium]|nr:DUF5320 domain-containing protein [Sedimentisphaerales bacterium]